MKHASEFEFLDLLSCPIFVLDITGDGVPVYAAINSDARELSGKQPFDYMGRTALETFPGPIGRLAYARQCQVVQSAKPLSYRQEVPGGAAMHVTLRPAVDADGTVTRIFGTSRDVATLRAAQEARSSLDTLSNEMEKFVAMAAHDLRAPMRNISLLANMLRDEMAGQSGARLDLIDLMDDVATKSMDLISDVLSHASVSNSAKAEIEFSLAALGRNIALVLDPPARHRIEVGDASLKTDRTALQIALRTLIEHAIAQAKRHRVDIKVSAQPGLPGLVDITMIDNGAGFSAAALKMLNDGSLHTDSGYGLFAIKRLINARGGSIFARNKPQGGGSMIRFSLPGEFCPAEQTAQGHAAVPRAAYAKAEIEARFTA